MQVERALIIAKSTMTEGFLPDSLVAVDVTALGS
jgi:hypothetical protein